ncbi:MAG TPA: hypothetical protein VE075_12235 [Thermoanaerobaculia bacterium]|nr:hypothetical protein [Thermoanaerobaculia bacterium]
MTGSVQCGVPSTYTVNLISCGTCPTCPPGPVPASCTQTTPVLLDLTAHAGCPMPKTPPQGGCGEGGAGGPPGAPGSPGSPPKGGGGGGAAEAAATGAAQPPCASCKQGGGGCSQDVQGNGPSCTPPAGGPGAFLRYRAGGVGGPTFPGTGSWTGRLGRYWSHDYAERIVLDPVTNDPSNVWLLTRYATFRHFQKAGAAAGTYTTRSPNDEYRVLTYAGSGSGCGATAGWQLKGLDGTTELFRADGYWCQTLDRNGNAWTAVYDSGDATQLDQVLLPDGRMDTFTYSGTQLATISEVGVGASPPARTWTYTWNASHDLTRIDRPDGTSWQFRYDDAANPGFVTRVTLLGTDHTSGRVEAAFDYDASGNTAHMWRGDPTGPAGPAAVDQSTFTYNNPAQPTQTVVTDALGAATTYALDWSAGVKARISQISGECGSCGLAPTVSFNYTDANNPLLPTTMTDGNGNVTLYTYDTPAAFTYASSGRLKTRTEAQSTAVQRTSTWTYGNTTYLAFPTQIDTPSADGIAGHTRTTVLAYDAPGNLQTRTQQGFEAGSTFSYATAYGYSSQGQVTAVDPPGFGTTDQTTFAFSVPNTNGQLPSSRTDPVVGTTSYGYDAYNRRITTTDPNGAVTETQYDLLNRVQAVIRHFQLNWVPGNSPDPNDLVTRYFYDCPAGTPAEGGPPYNIVPCGPFAYMRCEQRPNGNGIEYVYDPTSSRLIYVRQKTDCNPATQPSEQTVFSYNAAGNRTRESHQHWTGSAWVEDSADRYDYSVTCHVDKVTQGDGSPLPAVTEYCYDADSNLTKLWDADHARASFPSTPSQAMTYDALTRLTAVTLGSGETTAYQYDAQDHVRQITDPETNVTTLTISDRDLMTSQVSPAIGTTLYAYDPHGQMTAETDARGIVMSRTLDVLNRMTQVTYGSDASLTTRYTYDDPGVAFSKGRLTKINRGSGANVVGYTYDLFGRMLGDGTLAYAYDKNGNRTQLLYPGSPNPVSACYGYDALDRPISLGYTAAASCAGAITLVSGVTYKPQGPLSGMTLGNGVVETRNFDARYLPVLVQATKSNDLLKWAYTTDSLGNITAIADQTPASQNRSFGYRDYQYFLSCAAGPWSAAGSSCSPTLTGGPQQWHYDTIGNRLSEMRTSSSDQDTYAYFTNGAHDNPKLQQITYPGGVHRFLAYDAAGNEVQETGPATELDLAYDAAGELARMGAPSQGATVTMAYDGRGFLASAQGSAADCGPLATIPTYGSDGRLYVREHRSLLGNSLLEDDWVLYFGDRPVAQLAGTNAATATLTYLTTDPLGAPALATNAAGAAVWSGGFEAFGRDWQASTGNGALAHGIFLRAMGQWDDEVWSGAVKSGLYYNVNRWYEAATGRYAAADPLARSAGGVSEHVVRGAQRGFWTRQPSMLTLLAESEVSTYAFALDNAVKFADPLGLCVPDGPDFPTFLASSEGKKDKCKDKIPDYEPYKNCEKQRPKGCPEKQSKCKPRCQECTDCCGQQKAYGECLCDTPVLGLGKTACRAGVFNDFGYCVRNCTASVCIDE